MHCHSLLYLLRSGWFWLVEGISQWGIGVSSLPIKEYFLIVNSSQGSPVKAQLAHWPVPRDSEKEGGVNCRRCKKAFFVGWFAAPDPMLGKHFGVTRVSAETFRVISDLSVSSR